MFPITNQTVIGAVRSAALFAWVYVSGRLLSLEAVAELEGIGDFLAGVGNLLTGPAVVLIAGLVWAGVTKLAQLDNVVGTVFRYAFGFPSQPTYDVPSTEGGGGAIAG